MREDDSQKEILLRRIRVKVENRISGGRIGRMKKCFSSTT